MQVGTAVKHDPRCHLSHMRTATPGGNGECGGLSVEAVENPRPAVGGVDDIANPRR